MKSKKDIIRKALIGGLFLMVITLGACLPRTGLDQMTAIRATWTPIVQPTDRPFQAKPENLSYFGETPVLMIFGSQDPADNAPLKILNISTDDVYDVSTITPGSASTWSRPFMTGNKEVYFQIGGTLYVLSPDGQNRTIELPYNEENPAYCNWIWQGQLVCLSDSMTKGFLVDQDLNVVELQLPEDTGDGSERYYEPYRVGENTMRSVQMMTRTVDGRETVSYKDLNLETRMMLLQQIRIEQDFKRGISFAPSPGSPWVNVAQGGGNVDVIGISETGEKVYISSFVSAKQYLSTTNRWLAEVYDGLSLELLNYDIQVTHTMEKVFYNHYLITGWVLDTDNKVNTQPSVIDLESGEIIFEAGGSLLLNETINFILPYGDNWIAGDSSGVHYYRNNGSWMVSYTFSDEIIESMGPDSFYTVTQPMEP